MNGIHDLISLVCMSTYDIEVRAELYIQVPCYTSAISYWLVLPYLARKHDSNAMWNPAQEQHGITYRSRADALNR